MNDKCKSRATLIVLFLTLTIAAPLALPLASAHTPPWKIPTWCYIGVVPQTIGVNQEATIVFWLNEYPPTAQGGYGDRWTFTVEVTKPDGSKENLGPYTSDPVGSGWTSYTPTQVGTYTFVAKFPGKVLTGEPRPPIIESAYVSRYQYVNDTYVASTSDPFALTVQQDPIPKYAETPLPTGYWTRPIHGANREWYQVAGNWLGGAAQQHGSTTNFAYGEGPESAHILWTRPYWSGGVMDTRTGSIGYYTGLSYEGFGSPDFIIEGKIWYDVRTPPRYGYYCIDLYTGEIIYFRNTTGPVRETAYITNASGVITGTGFDQSGAISDGVLSFAQIYNYESPNQHGGFPYLWSTSTGKTNTWDMYDAYSGNYICSINNTNLATGTNVYGKDGSILYYNIANLGTTAAPKYYLRVWNTSQAIWYRNIYQTNQYWMWRPYLGYTFDGRNGYSLNASIPAVQGTIRAVREDQYIIGGTTGSNNEQGVTQGNLWALNLKPAADGSITPTLLWNITFTPPSSAGNLTVSMGTVDPENGMFYFTETKTRRRWGYSLATGQQIWESPSEPQFNFYGMSNFIYQGKYFGLGYSGVLIAYNATTGKIIYNWTAPDEGLGETWYPNTPLSMGVIADGKIYLYSTEHSPTMPLRRDANIWCLDAETGTLLWKIQAWPSALRIADGRLVYFDIFDNQIYCLGKGQSATTVSAPQTFITQGQSVMITGTVTDQSPSGRHNAAGSLDFTLKGTPAISDEDMEAWMEYLFQQRPIPANAKGVDVTLDTIDPNGNFIHIGTVTSDVTGTYGCLFTPEVPGTYKII
ncbi:MAG: PQQ-binding-like beta-propeller repeat protein, partial [Candidatus Bathyarchaeota archaeon]|nr:PQQ-binding-like beta-propeller repeat protein [Candidatus Bathyarchaeota archaeon]